MTVPATALVIQSLSLGAGMTRWGVSDDVLVSRCLQGEAASWRALVLRYRNLIYQIALAHFTATAEAADVFRDVCTELCLHLETIRDVENLEPWLIAVTLRKCEQVLNHRPHSRRPEAADRSVLARHIEDRIQGFRVERALEDLPEIERDLLQRLYGSSNPAPWHEIAKQLELQVERVGPTRVKSFVALGEILAERGRVMSQPAVPA